MTHKSRSDRCRAFKLFSKVGHVTRHAQQLFKVKRSKVKVTKSRDISADKNAITRQWVVISTSNLVRLSTWGSTRVVCSLGQYVKQTGSKNMADIQNIKCIVNRQIRVGDSKNVIVFDPLLTGHVIRRMRSGRVRIFSRNQWETLYLINQERIGVGASNLVGTIDLGVDACGILSRSVGQTNRK